MGQLELLLFLRRGPKKFSSCHSASLEVRCFGCSAISGHRTRPDGSDLKWKQIGVKEITDSCQLAIFIQWLTKGHSLKDGNAVSRIKKIIIADKDLLAESWLESEILSALDNLTIDWVDLSVKDGDNGIFEMHLSTPKGSIVFD